jgi:hypothetical protein
MMKSSQPRRPYEPEATPATLSSASATDLTCFSSICCWVTTLMDCAVSNSGASERSTPVVFVATKLSSLFCCFSARICTVSSCVEGASVA